MDDAPQEGSGQGRAKKARNGRWHHRRLPSTQPTPAETLRASRHRAWVDRTISPGDGRRQPKYGLLDQRQAGRRAPSAGYAEKASHVSTTNHPHTLAVTVLASILRRINGREAEAAQG